MRVFDLNRQSLGFAECEGRCRLQIDGHEALSGGENNLLSVRRPKKAVGEFLSGDFVFRAPQARDIRKGFD